VALSTCSINAPIATCGFICPVRLTGTQPTAAETVYCLTQDENGIFAALDTVED